MLERIAKWLGSGTKKEEAKEEKMEEAKNAPLNVQSSKELPNNNPHPVQEQKKTRFETKACPFCGNGVLSFVQHTLATGGKFDGVHLRIQCEYCGACGPLAASYETAVEKWNAWVKNCNQEPLWKSTYERIPAVRRRNPSTVAVGRWKRRGNFFA